MCVIWLSLRRLALLAGLVLLVMAVPVSANNDPWEPINTRIYTFNSYFDNWILRPIANIYNTFTPFPVREGVGNFLYNINDLNVLLNNLLQLKIRAATSDSGRILINTTLGIGGVFDVATHAGLQRNQEDFGQTLGYWGVNPGPYVVLPFLGPSNVRDTLGFSVDSFVNPIRQIESDRVRISLLVLSQIEQRAIVMQLESMMFGDEYLFVREAYLQQRQYLVKDGEIYDEYDDF